MEQNIGNNLEGGKGIDKWTKFHILSLQFAEDVFEAGDSEETSNTLLQCSSLLQLSSTQVHLKRVLKLFKIRLYSIDTLNKLHMKSLSRWSSILNLLNCVVLVHIPSMLLSLLVEGHQPLPICSIRVQVLLPGEDKIRIAGDGGPVGDKVGDRLHNVPAIFPPSQSGQDAKLYRHQAKTNL